MQFEHDIQQSDYSVNLKAMNVWPLDLTGIYIGSYLQSITKTLAVGVEYLYHSPAPFVGETTSTYVAKYTSPAKDMIATAQLQASGIIMASYWQKLSEKVDVAADLQLIATPERRDAVTTLGAKYDLRMSTFRAQVISLIMPRIDPWTIVGHREGSALATFPRLEPMHTGQVLTSGVSKDDLRYPLLPPIIIA